MINLGSCIKQQENHWTRAQLRKRDDSNYDKKMKYI